MKRFFLFLSICILLLTSETTLAQVAADYYFPLRVGNYWVYYAGNSSEWGARITRETIDGTDIISGREYHRVKGVEILDNNPSDSIIFHVLWLRQDSVGNILIGAFGGNSTNIDSAVLFDPPGLFFPNEFLNAGYSRESFDSSSGTYWQDSVLSTTETVNVTAGSFTNCLKIRDRHKDTLGVVTYVEYGFYAHNIGEVMRVREIPVNQAHTNDLIQYNAVASVEEREADLIPGKIALRQNYPNPLDPSIELSFCIPKKTQVTLKAYDLLGKEMATLINNEIMEAGVYEKQWDASSLPTGVYFCQLQAGPLKDTKKLILFK